MLNWLDTLLYGIRRILLNGVEQPERPAINFIGPITIADNPTENRLDITSPVSLATSPPVDVTTTPAAAGTSLQIARADHKHDILTAAPVAIGSTIAEGTSNALARADHVHTLGSFITIGTPAASAGSLRGVNGAQLLVARNAGNTGDLTCVATDASNNVLLGPQPGESGDTSVRGTTSVFLRDANGALLTAQASFVQLTPGLFRWTSTTLNPTITQFTGAGTGTGQTMRVAAQSLTGAAGTGGSLELAAGTGLGADGQVRLQRGTTSYVTVGAQRTTFSTVPIAIGTTLAPTASGDIGMGADGRPRVVVSSVVRPLLALMEAAGATTTAGTVTVQINSYPVPANRVQILRIFICGFANNGTGEGYERTIVVRRGASGAAVVVGLATPVSAEENGAANVTIAPDASGNLITSVTGAGGLNHTWAMVAWVMVEAGT